jgi:hypothetical protein
MTDIEKLTGMTDAECEYWDKHIIENTVEPGPNLLKLGIKPGFAHKAPQGLTKPSLFAQNRG